MHAAIPVMTLCSRCGPGARARGNTTRELILHSLGEGEGSLDLSNRTLSKEDVLLLAQKLASSTNLHTVTLYNVQISAPDAVILAKGLEFNDSLRCVSFDHNSIGEVGVVAVAEAVKFSTSLQSLSLASTVTNAHAAAVVASALSMNRSLTTLSIEGNRALGAQGAVRLAASLSVNNTLTKLNLSGCGLGDDGMTHVASALASNTMLLELELGSNDATSVGACQLADAIANKNTTLESLTLSRVSLPLSTLREAPSISLANQPLSANLDYPVVMRILKKNTRLRHLSIAQAGLCGFLPDGRGKRTPTGVRELNDFLLSMKVDEFVFLDLSYNGIQDEEAIVVSEGLSSVRGLVQLHISGNSFGVKGLSAILRVLPTTLEELCLTGNRSIGLMGGKELGDYVGDPTRGIRIKILRVEGCGMGDDGIMGLSRGISKCRMMEELNVEGNSIKDNGKECLGTMLLSGPPGWHNLKVFSCDLWTVKPGERSIDLQSSPLPGSPDVILLCGVIRSNAWLRTLVLDGSRIGSSGLSSLVAILYETTSISSVSLKGCGINAESGKILLGLARNKPGLCLHCSNNPLMGNDIMLKLSVAEARSSTMLDNSPEAVRGVNVHFIGPSGSGKTTLSSTLGRGYWASRIQWNLERADDRGAGDPELTTKGLKAGNVLINGERFQLWDYGGGKASESLVGSAGLLNQPYSIYICCISLLGHKKIQREQLKRSLRIIQACAQGDSLGLQARALGIVGSRADQMGNIGAEYLRKLYDSVTRDLAEEQVRVGMDPSLPHCICVIDVDSRKGNSSSIEHLRSVLCKAKADLIASVLVQCPKLYQHVEQKVSEWRDAGEQAIQWPHFWKRLQRDFCPRLPETTARTIAYGLSVAAGICLVCTRGGCAVRWVLLDPDSILGKFLGGIYFENVRQLWEEDVQLRLDSCGMKLSSHDAIAILLDMGLAAEEEVLSGTNIEDELLQNNTPSKTTCNSTEFISQQSSLHPCDEAKNVVLDAGSLTAEAAAVMPVLNRKRRIVFPGIWEKNSMAHWEGLLPNFSPMEALKPPGSETFEVFLARRLTFRSAIVVPGIFTRLQSALLQRYGARGLIEFGPSGVIAALQGLQVWVHNWDSCILEGSSPIPSRLADAIWRTPKAASGGGSQSESRSCIIDGSGKNDFSPAPWFDLAITAENFDVAKVELGEMVALAEEAVSLYPGLHPEIFSLSPSLLSSHHKCGDVSADELESALSMSVPLKTIRELQEQHKVR